MRGNVGVTAVADRVVLDGGVGSGAKKFRGKQNEKQNCKINGKRGGRRVSHFCVAHRVYNALTN